MTFSGINQWILCTSSGGKFHLTPPNSADFPLGFHPQNPPLATAYRFESGHRHHRPKSLVFQGFWAFFQFSRPGEKEVLTDLRRRFLGDNRRSDPNILPQAGFLHKFFAVSFRLFSAGQSKIEAQHTGRSQKGKGYGVPAVTVHRGLCQKRQTTDHHRPAV